jgi:hypothetical protein
MKKKIHAGLAPLISSDSQFSFHHSRPLCLPIIQRHSFPSYDFLLACAASPHRILATRSRALALFSTPIYPRFGDLLAASALALPCNQQRSPLWANLASSYNILLACSARRPVALVYRIGDLYGLTPGTTSWPTASANFIDVPDFSADVSSTATEFT